MAHNGIISNYVYGKDLSDTQNFVKDFVSVFKSLNKDFFLNESVMNLIEKEAGSKLCFLDNRENIYCLGDFEEDKGIKYSNSSYKKPTYSYSYYGGWKDWEDYKPKTKEKVNKKEYIEPFVEDKDYEILEPGDYYEFLDGSGDFVYSNEMIIVDSDYNIYLYQKDLKDKEYLSLIGENAIIYDKNFIIKTFYWDNYDYSYEI